MSEHAPVGSASTEPAEPTEPTGIDHRPPRTVVVAAGLLVVLAAIEVVNLVVAVLSRDAVRSDFEALSDLSPGQVDSAVTTTLRLAIGVPAVLLVGYLLLVRQLRLGRTWARILAVVLTALQAFGSIVLLSQTGASAPVKLLALVTVAVDLTVIALLFRPESKEFFAHR